MYHHSYTVGVHQTPLWESFNVIFDSENEIPTMKEFYAAVEQYEHNELRAKVLAWKFSFKCHVIFKI